MSDSVDSHINENYDNRNEEANYYDSTELNYYKPDIFNHLDNLLEIYHV